MNRLDYIENMWEIASCYDAGLPREYFPLCEMSGKKYVYHKERDEDTQELTEEICETEEWNDIPLPVSTEEESAIENYFFSKHREALKYAKENNWKSIIMVSIYPVITYELLPHSINVMDDGKKVTGILELWDDEPPMLCISEVNEDGELKDFGGNRFENYVIYVIRERIFKRFIGELSKSSQAYNFNLYIPQIHSSFGEMETIKNVCCSWKRIMKIANYYRKWGLVVVSWGPNNMALWAVYKHKSLSLPPKKEDVQNAAREWDKMIYDNPFLEKSFFENDNLTKWDYEVLEKARKKMK